MEPVVRRPQIGQWYLPLDKGEMFQIVGRDEESRTIEIQTADGDVDEIEFDTWSTLPLEACEPPENCVAACDVADPEDLGYSETAMTPHDWMEPLEALRNRIESWQEVSPEDERDPLGEGAPAEPFSSEEPAASSLAS